MTTADEWLKQNAKDSGAKIEASGSFMSLVTKNYLESPLCALQLGIAVMLDKPIVLIVDKNTEVSKHLVKIASLIEKIDLNNPEELKRAIESIGKFQATL